MNRLVVLTILVLCIASVVLARNVAETRDFKETQPRTVDLSKITAVKMVKNSTEVDGRARHKLKYALFPLLFGKGKALREVARYLPHALLGYGGFYTIAAMFAIKFKIIVTTLIVAAAVFYGFKYIAAAKGLGCDHIMPGISGYSHSGPEVYPGSISYTNPYEYSHHDHHDHHYSAPPSFHDDVDPYSAGGDVISDSSYPGSSTTSSGGSPPTSSTHYRRTGRRRRATATQEDAGLINPMGYDFTDLLFTLLSVNSVECRKRFTCEIDFMGRKDPFIQMGYRFLGPKLFASYRNIDKEEVKELKDCARMNPECKTPFEEESDKVSSVEVSSNAALSSEEDQEEKEIRHKKRPLKRRIWQF